MRNEKKVKTKKLIFQTLFEQDKKYHNTLNVNVLWYNNYLKNLIVFFSSKYYLRSFSSERLEKHRIKFGVNLWTKSKIKAIKIWSWV